jgi:hypothetical protein
MTKSRASKPQSIFERLAARGVSPGYAQIKSIVSLNIPHSTLFFERQFRDRTPAQVLRQVKDWRRLAERNFVLLTLLLQEIKKALAGAEMLAWNALVERALTQPVGPWTVFQRLVPTSFENGRALYIKPDTEITIIHKHTKEKRTTLIPHPRPEAPWGLGWEAAFQELGILDLVLHLPASKRLVSARSVQGWPIYTQLVIPNLYDFLRPYYPKRGHVWSGRETVLQREAFFPKELLEDMLDILKVEQPHAFQRTTTAQLKNTLRRYLAQKPKVPNPEKSSKSAR